MTATTRAPAAVRPVTDVDRGRILLWGALLGVAMSFVAAIGMVVVFDNRTIIDPILSLGYLALWWLPVTFGYRSAHEPTLEGLPAPIKGARDVVSGAVTGLIGGVGLGLFTFLVDAVFLRDILPNLSAELVDLLTFEQSVGVGFLITVVLATGLGALGGAAHLVAEVPRRAVSAAVQWVLVVALLESVVDQIFREVGIREASDLLFAKQGGLTIPAAVVVAAGTAFLSVRYRGKVATWRTAVKDLPQERRLRFSAIGAAVLGAALIGLPFILGGQLNELFSNVGLFLLMGLGLNVVVGLAGLLDLGYVAFFAVGAYTTAVLTSPLSPRFSPEIPFWGALPVVVVMAIIAGILVGTPVIRMRGDYLAIVTLGFGEIVRILFLSDWLSPSFGGSQGIRRIPGIPAPGGSVDGTNPQGILYIVIVFVALAAYISWRVQDSRIGRAWSAMREDESVAEVMGINTVAAKLLAFVVGAVLAALGGAVFAAKVGSVFPNSFELLVSIIILVVVIVGGMGNIPGVAVGALVLIGILGGPTQPGLLAEFQEFKLLIYGALLIYMMLQRPEGLVPSVRRSRELHQDEFVQDKWFGVDPGGDAVPEGDA